MISGDSVMTRSSRCALWQVAAGCLRSPPLRYHDAPRRESASMGLCTAKTPAGARSRIGVRQWYFRGPRIVKFDRDQKMDGTSSRRKSRRNRLLKSGKIILGKAAEIPCLVRNLSSLGACLEVQGTFAIPSEFDFCLSAQPARTCKIIWRDDTRLGVMFIQRD
jgi:hypothetical protein